MSTSHEQKNSEHCKDGASNNTNTSNNTSRIDDAIWDSIGNLDISNIDDDDKLFADPPPKEDCEICMLPLPFSNDGAVRGLGTTYQPCCGKTLCCGCMFAANKEMNEGNIKRLCPFCGIPLSRTAKEDVKRTKKRIKLNDHEALRILGCSYRSGQLGLEKNWTKALELWKKSAELGSIRAHDHLAMAYCSGRGVEQDMNKAIHHWKLAAIGGHETARHCLGAMEADNGISNGNMNRAMKHFMIAAKSGFDKSLKEVGEGYKAGHVTKDDYASTLRAYQNIINAMKSEERTEAVSITNRLMARK